MKTLFGADTTTFLTCFRILKFCNESIYDLFFKRVLCIEEEPYVNRIFSYHNVI